MPDNTKPKQRNGLAAFVERCPPTAQALILLTMFAGGGLSVGLLLDDIMGMPRRVEANTAMIVEQDKAHRAIMITAGEASEAFRDSILGVQGDILRTLRAWLCIEQARLEDRTTVQCGLQQLLPKGRL